MDVDRAISMLKALPYMSETIVDDTLYEKVLSFLTLVFSTHNLSILKPHVVTNIQAACDMADYRVTALSIRILGQWVHYSHDFDIPPTLLKVILDGITSSEASLRCACLESCRLFISCDQGKSWVAQHDERLSPVTLLDQSSYVVAEACRLFSTVLHVPELMTKMDPSALVLSLLRPQADQKQILSALDLCWELVSVQNQVALEYLRTRKLLHPLIPLLMVSNRMIRSRILEILSRLFSWDDDPLNTLNLGQNDSAYTVISRMAIEMIKEATVLDELLTGISFLNTSFILYKDESWKEAYQVLYDLYTLCMTKDSTTQFEHVPQMIRTSRARNNALQLIIRTVDTLVLKDHTITNEEHFIEFFDILSLETCYSDSRLLKATLGLLTNTLLNNTLSQLLTQSIQALVRIVSDDNTVLDCKSLSIVLDSFSDLLGHQEICSLMMTSGKPFVDALCLKFLDTEWDVRDASIHFVGQLFQDSNKVQFALNYNLPLEVFHRIHDSEPYVRASAIEVLEKMMQCKEGWDYVQQHKVARDLAAKLPNLLYDTEAFVRRAAIDAIVCLVQYRSCQGMAMEIKESSQHLALCPEILARLIQDQDTDVRIRACRLIENLWFLYKHEIMQKKKNPIQDHEITFFQHIQAEELLVEAVNDTNRVVRIEAVRVIENLLVNQDNNDDDQRQSAKRQHTRVEADDEFETDFINKLKSVNLEEKKQTLDPEHLYQEAFDINADMMTRSIIPTDPEDDINMLDCY